MNPLFEVVNLDEQIKHPLEEKRFYCVWETHGQSKVFLIQNFLLLRICLVILGKKFMILNAFTVLSVGSEIVSVSFEMLQIV